MNNLKKIPSILGTGLGLSIFHDNSA